MTGFKSSESAAVAATTKMTLTTTASSTASAIVSNTSLPLSLSSSASQQTSTADVTVIKQLKSTLNEQVDAKRPMSSHTSMLNQRRKELLAADDQLELPVVTSQKASTLATAATLNANNAIVSVSSSRDSTHSTHTSDKHVSLTTPKYLHTLVTKRK